ncbi:uncharacterized protein C15orf61-like [Argiope bruennichi]|uniref:Uncharacterized protein n=1 Tax=Argiope bruennichi TaxID=94029 RepID=A0A8T0E275_ARGBR|nr:uncharacterized protein C15orf61-like [Argiope bruennichi]KAF8764255.1 hypothetical protein HNY73_022347 [Argiope bruennichi]
MKNRGLYGPITRISLLVRSEQILKRPAASEVLSCHIKQRKYPPWTSYFVKYNSILNDQFGLSHFNWQVEHANYHILRTGCFPYIKYHCTKRHFQNLEMENKFFLYLKVLNLGLPTLAYGLGALLLIKFEETVNTPLGPVKIFFLNEEKDSMY